MMTGTFELKFDLKSIDKAAGELLEFFPQSRIFAFYGEMGAGKTTFIRAVCRHLGVGQFITSPSFAIVNEYPDQKGEKSYFHFDFYRIEKIDEVLDIGYEDYFYSENMCFIEWPERIASLLPENTIELSLDIINSETRRLTIKRH